MMEPSKGQGAGLPWLFSPFPDSLISFLLLVPLTVPSWEEAPHVPRLPPPVHKTKVPLAMASNLFRAHELPSTHLQSSGPSSGSPERGTPSWFPGGSRGGGWVWSQNWNRGLSGFPGRWMRARERRSGMAHY